MCLKNWLILFVSVFTLSCFGKRVVCRVPKRSINLLKISDETRDPYVLLSFERNFFRELGIERGTDGDYLLVISLDDLSVSSIGHDKNGYSTHDAITLKATIWLYERGRVEPLFKRSLSVRDSYIVDSDPSIAISKRKASIDRLSLKLCRKIEVLLSRYFCLKEDRNAYMFR